MPIKNAIWTPCFIISHFDRYKGAYKRIFTNLTDDTYWEMVKKTTTDNKECLLEMALNDHRIKATDIAEEMQNLI